MDQPDLEPFASEFDDDPGNIYAARARCAIESYHNKSQIHRILNELKRRHDEEKQRQRSLTPLHAPQRKYPRPTPQKPVCIIGAGAAGLYTAMIFDSLGIPYVILEASNRVGGRLFTYRGFKNAAAYDYFDVGAMRFPKTPFMKRTFDLIEKKLKNVRLIDYMFKGENVENYYPYSASGYVPEDYYNNGTGYKQIMENTLRPFRDLFARNKIADAISQLMKFDMFTTRSWMTLPDAFNTQNSSEFAGRTVYPSSVVNWCETMDQSTGSFDRALTETVLESIAFDWPSKQNDWMPAKPIKWFCIDGGSQELAEAMHSTLNKKAEFNKVVTAIAMSGDAMKVTFEENNQRKSADYFAVISTMPLPRLRFVDLSDCYLSYAQWSAIRGLQYGPAVKIGIRFREPWWESIPNRPPIVGGQAFTDLPVRTVVYPSYPAGETKSRVLIASYCWTQDAEPELIEKVMNDLAKIHCIDVDKLWALYTPGDYFAKVNRYPRETKAEFHKLWGHSQYWDKKLIKDQTRLGNYFSNLESGKLHDFSGKPMKSDEYVIKERKVKESV